MKIHTVKLNGRVIPIGWKIERAPIGALGPSGSEQEHVVIVRAKRGGFVTLLDVEDDRGKARRMTAGLRGWPRSNALVDWSHAMEVESALFEGLGERFRCFVPGVMLCMARHEPGPLTLADATRWMGEAQTWAADVAERMEEVEP